MEKKNSIRKQFMVLFTPNNKMISFIPFETCFPKNGEDNKPFRECHPCGLMKYLKNSLKDLNQGVEDKKCHHSFVTRDNQYHSLQASVKLSCSCAKAMAGSINLKEAK